MQPRVLVAGIGNIFLGDDAFGSEVARRLAAVGVSEAVRVVDYGIRGLDLSYDLLDGYEAVILVDAAPGGGPPGTLRVLVLETDGPVSESESILVEGHNLDPSRVLQLARTLGAKVGRLLLVGVEPTPSGESDDFGTGLSAAVGAAVEDAIPLVGWLVDRLLRGEAIEAVGSRNH